jgi:diaminohydroxyphosphoribosylaminopyrimidine deaminase / 5-amino-6-(5-phosphoribosylamino)uracil reductase
MSRSLDLPAEARLWDGARQLRTVVLTAPGHGRAEFVEKLRGCGVEVVEVAGLRPRDAMRFLYEQDALSVLWECGGRLAAAAIADGCIQKVHAFVAPKIVGGGADTPTPVAAPALAGEMGDALALSDVSIEQFEGDVLISGYLSV